MTPIRPLKAHKMHCQKPSQKSWEVQRKLSKNNTKEDILFSVEISDSDMQTVEKVKLD